MPLDIDKFAELRPVLYHFTALPNLEGIRTDRALHCAEALFGNLEPKRRNSNLLVAFRDRAVIVRDQLPLYRAHVELLGDWTWEKLLSELNARVFFWPGTRERLVPSGQRSWRTVTIRPDR